MTERLPSDHDAVTGHRVHLERVGRTSRLRVPLPEDVSLGADDVVRLSLEGEAAHAQVAETLSGALAIDGAAENARLARTGEGADRLRVWIGQTGLEPGDPVILDELTPGYAYGLRRPGERVIYAAPDAPDDSLSAIAEDLRE